jgi:hypothetical protein
MSGAGQLIRRIGLDQQPIQRGECGRGPRTTGALAAEERAVAEHQAAAQPLLGDLGRTGEAVHHPAGDWAVVEGRQGVSMGTDDMENDRQLEPSRQRELSAKAGHLALQPAAVGRAAIEADLSDGCGSA